MPLKRHPSATPGWGRLAWQRMRHLLWLKAIGISLFCWVFFIAYFHLLRHPQAAPLQMPLTPLDPLIGFGAWALGPYVSLWFYVGIPVVLQASLRHAIVYGGWAGALCLAGLACFYLVPTAIPPLDTAPDLAVHLGFSMLQGIDAAGNACPSLHVATALFSAVWVDRLLRDVNAPLWPRALNAGWFFLIAYSTLAIKQHVVLDVVAGVLLGALFAAASRPWWLRVARRGAAPERL
jgi:membrane-associated phospholipid phosphatase